MLKPTTRPDSSQCCSTQWTTLPQVLALGSSPTATDFQPYEIALSNVLRYALKVRSGLRSVLHNFNKNDHRYAHLARMTKEDLSSIINEITLTQNQGL